MAMMHTKLRGNETESEAHIFQLLEKKLPGDYHVWHDFIAPKNQIAIDFAVLHPKYGMWIIAVKDWLIHQLRRIDAEKCCVMINGKEIEHPNPIREVREHHYPIRNLLMEKSTLLHQQGKFEGNLLFPMHHLVIFSKLSKDEMVRKEIYHFFPEHQIITAEAVRDANLTEIALENLLIEKRSPRFLNHHGLSDAQISAIDQIFNPAAGLSEQALSALLEKAAADDRDDGKVESEPVFADDISSEKIAVSLPDALVLNNSEPATDEISGLQTEKEVEQLINETPAEREILITSREMTTGEAGEIPDNETPEMQPPNQIESVVDEPQDQAAANFFSQTGQNAPTELQKSLMTIFALNQQLLQKMWSKG